MNLGVQWPSRVDPRDRLVSTLQPRPHTLPLENPEFCPALVLGLGRGPEAAAHRVDLRHRRLVQLPDRHDTRIQCLRAFQQARALQDGEVLAAQLVANDDVAETLLVLIEQPLQQIYRIPAGVPSRASSGC